MALDRKTIKRPDEFVSTTRGMLGGLAKYKKGLVALAGVLIAGIVGSLVYGGFSDSREKEAQDALHLARAALNEDLKSLAAEFDPKPKQDAKKAVAKKPAKADGDATEGAEPEWQPDPRAVAFRKLDVNARMPQAVSALTKVVEEHKGTRASFEASLTLGDLYHDHGAPKEALDWYEKAAASAPGAFEKTLAHRAKGYSFENSGEPDEALKEYEKALGYGVASLKGDLLLAKARCQEELKQVDKAKETYDRILTELPNTAASRSAELFKSRI